MTAASAFIEDPLATLVKHYRVLWHELAAATDREQQAVVCARLRYCWDALKKALAAYPGTNERLVALVNLYRVLQRELITAGDPQQQELRRTHLCDTCDMLWNALAEPLTRLASRWLRSALAKNLFENPASYASKTDVAQALALSAFADLLEHLPALDLNPHQNVLGYLLTIAHRKLYQQNGLYSAARPGSRESSRPLESIVSDAPTEMWPHAARPIDESPDDFKDRTLTQIYDQQSAAALRSYIVRALSPIEQTILERRLQDPPLEFAAIAAEFGPPWTENSVRVRHHRAIEEIRAYVEARILVAMCDQHCAAEVWALVHHTLPPVDETILQIRWRTHPPVELAAIAAELGADWTTARVRERHRHAMTSIFAHLRSLGLVDLG